MKQKFKSFRQCSLEDYFQPSLLKQSLNLVPMEKKQKLDYSETAVESHEMPSTSSQEVHEPLQDSPPFSQQSESSRKDSQLEDLLKEFQSQVYLKVKTLPPMIESQMEKFLICVPLEDGKPVQPFPIEWHESSNSEVSNKHVLMPYSYENKFVLKTCTESGIKEKLVSRWDVIVESLKELMEKKDKTSKDIENAITKYHKTEKDFDGLHAYFNRCDNEERSDFFENVLPKIITLVLLSKKICTKPLPLLVKQKNCSVTMSQLQAACILANAFFSTFPNKRRKTYPTFNFFGLYKGAHGGRSNSQFGKLDCLVNYFRRVQLDNGVDSNGVLTFERQVIRPRNSEFWSNCETKISHLYISAGGLIEKDGVGMLQVDFANKYLGGGVLRFGCVQEEIRFLVCPEAIISCLITEELNGNECLFIIGCEQYSTYSGYSRSFQWNGNFQDETPRDFWRRRMTEMVAIDALVVDSYDEQFQEVNLLREINKAYCGFSKSQTKQLPPVATGNWGCGAFGGDPYLKALIQIMAASEAGRDVCYLTFGNHNLATKLSDLHTVLRNNEKSVGFLWNCIVDFSNLIRNENDTVVDLYGYIKECVITE